MSVHLVNSQILVPGVWRRQSPPICLTHSNKETHSVLLCCVSASNSVLHISNGIAAAAEGIEHHRTVNSACGQVELSILVPWNYCTSGAKFAKAETHKSVKTNKGNNLMTLPKTEDSLY